MTVKSASGRSVPASAAPILEDLELRQPKVVTKALLAEIASQRQVRLSADEVAHRLQRHGWLLPLRTRGAWEFAPASRAGAIDSGDRLIELRATLLRRPDFQAAVAYESAAWLHGFARRVPTRDVLAIPPGVLPPPALRHFRITRQWGKLDPVTNDALPVWRIETLIVLMANYPMGYKAWPTVSEWLPEAVSRVSADLILRELTSRRKATWARVGYVLEVAGRRDLADQLFKINEPAGRGPSYLGPRRAHGKFNKRWDLVDSILYPSLPAARSA